MKKQPFEDVLFLLNIVISIAMIVFGGVVRYTRTARPFDNI